MNKQVLILWVGLFIAIGLFFQNCSRNLVVEVPSANQSSQSVTFQSKASCVFNGKEVQEGLGVLAYLNSTPEFTNGCLSENRFCRNGALSGTFTYARCQAGPKSCLFNGITIESGASIQAYSAPNPTDCATETRKCTTEGRLSGSLPYSSCKKDVCLFNGRTLTPGQAFTYYTTATGSCQAKTGNCQVGGFLVDSQRAPLTGAIYETCSAQAGACLLQSGETIAQNQTFTYYSPASGCQAGQGYCDSQSQLKDTTTQAALSSPFSDASTCNMALTVANAGIPSGGTNGTYDPSLPNCHWRDQIVPWGSQFNYYYYPEGYYWQCQPARGFCYPDGTLKTWPRFQSLNGDQIYPTCTVIPEPPPDGSNGG